MLAKTLSALLTVLLGVGAALLVYWVLNKIAELLPGKWESRIKPYFYILPAYLAIAVYLLYPAVLTVINSFKDRFSREWVGTQNYTDLFSSDAFRQTLLNTLLWIIIVPAVTVALGLLVAVLADRLGPRGEKFTKTMIFLPMAISMIGAATIWRFVYDAQPKGTDADRPDERLHRDLRLRPGAMAADQHPAPQQPAAHGHPAVGPGRLLDGAALRGRQGGAGGHRRGRPHRRRG